MHRQWCLKFRLLAPAGNRKAVGGGVRNEAPVRREIVGPFVVKCLNEAPIADKEDGRG